MIPSLEFSSVIIPTFAATHHESLSAKMKQFPSGACFIDVIAECRADLVIFGCGLFWALLSPTEPSPLPPKAIDRPRHQQHPNQNLRGTFEPGRAIPIRHFEVTDSAFIKFVWSRGYLFVTRGIDVFVLTSLFSGQKQRKEKKRKKKRKVKKRKRKERKKRKQKGKERNEKKKEKK